MKQMCKRLVIFVVMVTLLVSLSTVGVVAKSKNPYKDVVRNKTTKTVSKNGYRAIKALKKFGTYKKGLKIKKNKFKPHKPIKKKECMQMLINRYGKDNVSIDKGDMSSKKTARAKWWCHELEQVADEHGMVMHYTADNCELDREYASIYMWKADRWMFPAKYGR